MQLILIIFVYLEYFFLEMSKSTWRPVRERGNNTFTIDIHRRSPFMCKSGQTTFLVGRLRGEREI